VEARRTDPDDNKFLECALEAEADYLVTGNLKDYPIEEDWAMLVVGDPAGPRTKSAPRIVFSREFLSIIEM
jgi:predicted nucleic acid-binding protein